ncbi:MAG: class I SAM-dependent methyltransferase [Candidatus Magasanikbacteria bacterium]|nr:class I SAM-dependent methyltransferase [Candidatus Magasanikbacteria bacterium]
MQSIGPLTECQICEDTRLTSILDLGHQAPVHAHLSKEQLRLPENTFPLRLVLCQNCGLVQLDYIGDPSVIFPPEYPYQTGMTRMLVKNFQELSETLLRSYQIPAGALIVDIGSNDGTLLKPFKDQGLRVLGIEPTNVARVANKQGIRTIQEYINLAVATQAVEDHGKASIVTLANAFAHIFNLFELMDSIKILLADDGIFVSESQYLVDAIEKTAFDTIYHEHIRFYSLSSLEALFSRCGFSIIDAERIPAAGGSIRVVAKKGKHEMSTRAKTILKHECSIRATSSDTLHHFASSAMKSKLSLMRLLSELKMKGARIAALGAPARGNSLLSSVHIGPELVDYACEKTGSPKIGLFTPGTHIPIMDEKKLFEEQPEYLLVLSWHIGEELINKMRELGYRGHFIIPLPEPHLVK